MYFLLFLFGGTIATYNLAPYRMAYVTILPLLFIPKFGIRRNHVFKAAVFFAGIIFLSAWINGSSASELVLFLRHVIVPYLMYYSVQYGVTKENAHLLFRFSLAIGFIQLPIVIVQAMFYDQLSVFFSDYIAPEDALFGTFYMADDAAMSFFLLALVIFLLLDKENNTWVPYRFVVAIYFSMTILVSNSEISHLIVVVVWIYWVLRRVQGFAIRFASIGLAGILLVSLLAVTDLGSRMVENVQLLLGTGWEDQDIDKFLRGDYARGAAVLYYLSEPLKIIGDGPSKYYDPVSKEFLLGNRGQVFTFYSEVGMLGVASSFWFLFRIGAEFSSRIRWPLVLSVAALSITSSVMSDASIMFAYTFFLRTSLLSQK